jgi:iduronate 2-sulfatase
MAKAGAQTRAISETVDLYPTLCELTGITTPANLAGNSLMTHLLDPSQEEGEALAYSPGKQTIRTSRYRLIRHGGKGKAPAYELYDHTTPEAETKNIADSQPEIVKKLAEMLNAKIP